MQSVDLESDDDESEKVDKDGAHEHAWESRVGASVFVPNDVDHSSKNTNPGHNATCEGNDEGSNGEDEKLNGE